MKMEDKGKIAKKIVKNRAKKRVKKLAVPLASLIILLFLVFVNVPVFPHDNFETTQRKVSFRWFGFGKLIIDTNEELTSPLITSKKILDLEPGTYYWCVSSIKRPLFCKPRKLKITSTVILEIENKTTRGENETLRIKNKGNVNVILRILRSFRLTGSAILSIVELPYNKSITINVPKNSTIIAEQK